MVRGRNMRFTLRPSDHPILSVIFGVPLAYILWGALIGDLYIPEFGHEPAHHLSGFAAWLCVSIPFLFYLSFVVEDSPHLNAFWGRAIRLGLWLSGGFVLFWAIQING